jgi:hypothetical protein
LVYGELEDAAAELCGVGGLVDALLEFDVLVPERVALEVKTNKVGAALEETVLSASMFMEPGVGEEGMERVMTFAVRSLFADIKVNRTWLTRPWWVLARFVGRNGEETKLRAASYRRIYNQTVTSTPKPAGARRWLWCDLSSCSGEERQDLLSNDVVVMGRIHLERAVVCPEVNRGRDARNTALIDLFTISLVFTKQLQLRSVPSQPSQCRQSRTRDRHTSSSIRKTAGTC